MKIAFSSDTKKRWRNRLIFVLVAIASIGGYIYYINSFDIYDFSHLTQAMSFGPPSELAPMNADGRGSVPGMDRVAENDYIALYVNMYNATIAVYDKRNSHVWRSEPEDSSDDPIANPFEIGVMRSNLGFRFYDDVRRRNMRWLYHDASRHGQFEFTSIPNGVRIEYFVGNLDVGIDAIPFFMEANRFEERVRSHFTENADLRFFMQFWHPSLIHEGFMQMSEGIRDSVINTNRMIGMFEYIGYTLEELEYDNASVGREMEISFDFFTIVMEFVIDGDSLIVNIPLSDIEVTGDSQIFDMDLMRFFGAGGSEDDGYILVPSGSGGIINFNNGQFDEDPFISSVYGLDLLMNFLRPQVEQSVRLPVFGIHKNGAAMLAHVYSGQGLATINADVAGRINSYNRAWFSFTLRTSTVLDMGAIPGATGDMTIVQNYAYTGDITVRYHFIADNAGIGDMARVYRNFLIEQGALTRIDGSGDRTFYLDVVAGIDARRHFLGTPYLTVEAMTTIDDAHRFLDILDDAGINNVQMQLHGWFNRGINHDVAKNINLINSVGSRRDLHELSQRLMDSGGNLNPSVNFQFTNFDSRRMNRTFETAKDPAGFIGFMSRVSRDILTTRFSHHRNDWFLLVHPAVLPFHMDRFIPAFERQIGLPSLALTDLGDILTESMYRRDPVDREHSRLIVVEQFERLNEVIPYLVVSGGNDYSLAFASHVVDAPTEPDMFYIIDHGVPFFPMVIHGYIEFAGRSANLRENFDPLSVLLNSMATGASPRYTMTALPTRQAQFTPHERLYSTHYIHWMGVAIEHYQIFNEVYRDLRGQVIVDFEILSPGVTCTVFEDGTRIYVNNTNQNFEHTGTTVPAMWFVVR